MASTPWTPALSIGLCLALASCGGKGGDTGGAAVCTKPTAEAGDSQVLPLGAEVSLNASGSRWCDSFGAKKVTFTWATEQVPTDSAVTEASFTENRSANATETSFIPDRPGEYVLSLRVNDPTNASDPDYVVVTINTEDQPPLADCGGDVLGNVGVAATVDGSSSTDPEGAQVRYSWGMSSVPECSSLGTHNIFDQGSNAATIIPDCTGLYVVSLVVSDGLQDSTPDYCLVNVRSDNDMPVADAGEGGVVPPCGDNPFQLSGWGSYDPEGDSLTYQWSVVTAPPGADADAYSFDDASSVEPRFTWDQPGEWTFQLQVSDPFQPSTPKLVTYLIHDLEGNSAPTANAGEDVEVVIITTCIWGWPSYICDPCEEVDVPLDGTLSTDPDDDPLNYEWRVVEGDLVLSSTTHAVADAVFPERTTTYGSVYSQSYSLDLQVRDCQHGDDDQINLTYTCRGGY